MEEVIQMMRKKFKAFPRYPEAAAWVKSFGTVRDRYPFLLLVGPSRAGKTEYAKSLFKSPLEVKVGTLEQFPEGVRKFNRKTHDALVLDDVRDLEYLVRHQEKLQSKYDFQVELGTTPGGQCAYWRWLWRRPILVTANFTTKNLGLLDTDDFLGNPENRVVVRLPARPL